jgi:hypothetical protein
MPHFTGISFLPIWYMAVIVSLALLSPVMLQARIFIRFRDIGPPRTGLSVGVSLIFAVALASRPLIIPALALAAFATYSAWAWAR